MTRPDDGDPDSKDDTRSYYPRVNWDKIKNRAIIISEFVIASASNPNNLAIHLTWFFTLLLAIFAYGAWQETRIDFQLDQRPILDISDTPIPWNVDGPIYDKIIRRHVACNYAIKNFGKGTAFDIRICPFTRIGGSRFIASSSAGENLQLVPTKFIWQTASFPEEFNLDEIKLISDENFGVVLKLAIHYKDTFGSIYDNIVCQSKLPNGNLTVGPCTGYPYKYIGEDTDNCDITYR